VVWEIIAHRFHLLVEAGEAIETPLVVSLAGDFQMLNLSKLIEDGIERFYAEFDHVVEGKRHLSFLWHRCVINAVYQAAYAQQGFVGEQVVDDANASFALTLRHTHELRDDVFKSMSGSSVAAVWRDDRTGLSSASSRSLCKLVFGCVLYIGSSILE
jgi:hypothetical protein